MTNLSIAGPLPGGVDHLVYAASSLERGMNEIEGLLGVRPVLGGRHPRFGTRNALVAIGERVYLEVIAPDPELPRPDRGLPFGLEGLERSRLATWVLCSERIEALVAAAAAQGLDLGCVASGRRETPEGGVVSWQLSDPYAQRLGGAVPFVIAWGETPHPAAGAQQAGVLAGLSIEHPDPAAVDAALAALGVALSVEKGPTVRLTARVRTEGGDVEIR